MELLLGLVGALIGAAAVVGAQIVSARTSLRLERDKQRRSDIATATRSLLRALQAEQWLVWKAANDPASLSESDLADYDKSAYEGFSTIAGDLGVLSATWPDAYRRYVPIAAGVFTFDEQIAQAVVQFRRDPAVGVERMVAVSKQVLSYHWYAYEQVFASLRERTYRSTTQRRIGDPLAIPESRPALGVKHVDGRDGDLCNPRVFTLRVGRTAPHES